MFVTCLHVRYDVWAVYKTKHMCHRSKKVLFAPGRNSSFVSLLFKYVYLKLESGFLIAPFPDLCLLVPFHVLAYDDGSDGAICVPMTIP